LPKYLKKVGEECRIVVISGEKCNYVGESGKFMARFRGDSTHSVDAKGRMIVPSKFREMLGDTFVITKGFDRCLYIYDMDNWEIIEDKLLQMPMLTEEARLLRRTIVGSVADVQCDKMGRVLIPATLRDYANIQTEAVIVGSIDHIEVMSKEAWERTNDIDPNVAAAKLYGSGASL